jgi:hypothetical protein
VGEVKAEECLLTEERHPRKSLERGQEEVLLSYSMPIPRERKRADQQENKKRPAEHIPARQIAMI